jgi:hypothetical protein
MLIRDVVKTEMSLPYPWQGHTKIIANKVYDPYFFEKAIDIINKIRG